MKRLWVIAAVALSACIQTTGGNVVSFDAVARGTTEAAAPFTTPSGFDVTLTRARVTVGALYLNQQNPQSYTLEQACIQEGIYSGEVRGGGVVDALSADAQPFPVRGNGTDAPTRAAELWLTGGDLLADDDKTVVLDVAGTATRGADVFPFEGVFTIGTNRVIPPRNAALPGSNPLCRQRIVSPVAFDATLAEGSTVTLVVDARQWFAAVDFSGLAKVSDAPLLYRFTDSNDSSAQPDKALFNGLRSAQGPYRFELSTP